MSKIINKEIINKDKNVKYIKKFLRKHGGLLITNRQVGKTQALIELLHEDEDAYIVTFNYSNMRNLKNRYMMNFKDGKEERIIAHDFLKKNFDLNKAYIDEYFFQKTLYPNFKGAVSTMKFPVKIKKFDNGINDEEMRITLGEQFCATEHSLKFK